MNAQITPAQIIAHRAARKDAGLLGCITSKPKSNRIVFGYSDVYSWRPADPMNPHCFCIDCRELWDSDGSIDVQLVNNGHKWACHTYASLLPSSAKAPPAPAPSPSPEDDGSAGSGGALPSLALPTRSMTHYPGVLSCEKGCWCGHWERQERSASPPPARTMTEHPEAYKMGVPRSVWFTEPTLRVEVPTLSATRFEDVPTSLPAPRHRDIMNETPETRLRNDLVKLLAETEADLIRVMDSRRNIYTEMTDRSSRLAEIDTDEDKLIEKVRAIKSLLTFLPSA
jgi:hypothetical protein